MVKLLIGSVRLASLAVVLGIGIGIAKAQYEPQV
jgi:hypothetical protein